MGGLADENSVRGGKRLQSRSEIGRLTDDSAFLRGAAANDLPDDHKTGGNADPGAHRRPVWAGNAADVREDRQRRADSALSGILECARESEIGENAVAHEFGDVAAVASDRAGGGVLIA